VRRNTHEISRAGATQAYGFDLLPRRDSHPMDPWVPKGITQFLVAIDNSGAANGGSFSACEGRLSGGRRGEPVIDSREMSRRWWVCAVPLLCACVSTTSVVRSRFAVEQGCPEDRVVVDEQGGTLYRARGCEKETIYACGAVAAFRGGAQCVQEGLPNPPGYREPDRAVLPPPDPRLPPPP
jgi:hypothetical protein